MKIAPFVFLMILASAYLALCAYGIAVTGSTPDLADIGDAAAVVTFIGAVAQILKR